MKRKVINILIATALCFAYSTMYAQNISDESIVGTWKMDGENRTSEYKQDGTYIDKSGDLTLTSGTYSVSEQSIIFGNGFRRRFSIKDNTLTLYESNGTVFGTLTRVTVTAANNELAALAEGEILYRGTTKLEKCDEATISFVLTANKDTIKNFSVLMDGIYVRQSNGSISKINSKTNYGAKIAVKGGSLDYTHFNIYDNKDFRIIIKQGLGADSVSGEFNFVYEVSRNQREDLGTAPIELKRVQ